MKLSFSINSKSKPASLPRPASAAPDADDAETASTVPQFVTEFDPTRPLSQSESSNAVLAPIPNSDYIRRFKPTLPLPSADDDPSQFSAEANFVLDTNNSADPSGLPYGLSIRSDKEKGDVREEEVNGTGRKRGEKPENMILKRFKEDMQTLPDAGGPDEFKGTQLDDLAAALLRGYGWTEGKGLGRNKDREDTKIVNYQKRGGTYGLGFNPSAADPKKNRSGDWVLPNNVSQEKSEKDENKQKEKERNSRREENLERERASSTRRKGENGNEREERVGRRRDETERERSDNRRREEKDRDRALESSRKRKKENEREEQKKTKEVRWLRSHIRVRIISKDFKKGRYYLKKGEVLDVVGPTTCDISIDETCELLQGVEQEMLETALPKKGGAVLVLYGKHKGVFGNLVEKDLKEETGVVRDADSHELLNVHLEQIAEYLGDPAYLGY